MKCPYPPHSTVYTSTSLWRDSSKINTVLVLGGECTKVAQCGKNGIKWRNSWLNAHWFQEERAELNFLSCRLFLQKIKPLMINKAVYIHKCTDSTVRQPASFIHIKFGKVSPPHTVIWENNTSFRFAEILEFFGKRCKELCKTLKSYFLIPGFSDPFSS